MTNETGFVSFFLKILENSMQVMWDGRLQATYSAHTPAVILVRGATF